MNNLFIFIVKNWYILIALGFLCRIQVFILQESTITIGLNMGIILLKPLALASLKSNKFVCVL